MSPRSLPPEPRETDIRSGRTDAIEEKIAECMTVGAQTRGLTKLERFVLDAVYGDGLSVQEIHRQLVWANRHGFRPPWRSDTPRMYRHVLRLQRDAERKVEKRLEERGLIGG